MVANRTRLGDARLRPFVDALKHGVQFLINHPDESWKLFVAAHKDLNDELDRDRFASFLKDQGLIREVPPLESYAVELR